MPWTALDATRHTRKAKGKKRSRQWAHVANRVLAGGASEASAIRQANSVVGRARRKGGAMNTETVREARKGRRRGKGKRR